MKKAFNECFKAVVNCEEEGTGRKRCELFREVPDHRVRTLSLFTSGIAPLLLTIRYRSTLTTTN